jgi:hypothetical protein
VERIDFEQLGRSFFDWAMKAGIATGSGFARQNNYEQGAPPQFLTIPEIADRWRCSRGTVYNRLVRLRIKILDFAAPGATRGKKVVPRSAILEVESRQFKRI